MRAFGESTGGAASKIEINADFPIYTERAIDLGCHEGYPGHHVYNALLEQTFVKDRGWVEMSVYPLFSPMSLIAEGSAQDMVRDPRVVEAYLGEKFAKRFTVSSAGGEAARG
mgnify:CR=1 FL=1